MGYTLSKGSRGPIAKKVRYLCFGMHDDRITDEGFKQGLRDILVQFGKTGWILQDIGLVIEKQVRKYYPEEKHRIWKLADEVDDRIQELKKRFLEEIA